MATALICITVVVVLWAAVGLIVALVVRSAADATDDAQVEWTRRVGSVARWIPGLRTSALQLELFAALARGDVSAMTRSALALSPRGGRSCTVRHSRILVINALIAAGLYKEALALPEIRRGNWPFSVDAQDLADALIDLNLAEAEYNLGQWDAAWGRLDRAAPLAAKSGVTKASDHLQRCWILANRGDAEGALAQWEQVCVDDIPAAFRAEVQFAKCCALMVAGDHEEALKQVDAADAVAVRASSKRNALFLRARVLMSLGREEEALIAFESAAQHPYQGQGGDGLLAWGDLLQRRGDGEGARAAWQLTVDRDPQSESAAVARQRVNSHFTSPTAAQRHAAGDRAGRRSR